MPAPKILIVDIETAPNIVYTWGHWKQNISPKQVIKPWELLSYAAKWLGDGEIFYEENREGNDQKLVSKLCELLDSADYAVAHNGDRFDFKKIRAQALVHGLRPPSPIKTIDTLLVARREFGFAANSLEYLLKILKCNTQKGGHKKFPGFDLWIECLKGNEEAWQEMKDYNIKDIVSLEELYLKLRPWDTKHPNIAIMNDVVDKPTCPKCGGQHLQYRGFAYSNVGKFHRLHCQDCGGWSRTRFTLLPKSENLLANQVN